MKNIVGSLFLMGAAAYGVTACSDDHFDVVVSGTSSASLMENMKSQPDLKSFVTILEKTRVMRTDNDKNATISYADLLSQDQNFTVWAPVDGSSTSSYVQRYLDLLEEASQVEKSDPERFRELNWQVENQLVRNHIARANYESTPTSQMVRLMNNKRCEYTASENTFNGIKLRGSVIPASNGVLHLLESPSPYAYNIYDYLAENPQWSDFNDYVHSQDTTIFNPSSSIEGAIVDGEMVYVDSVFYTSSPLTSYLGSISSEDSTYVGVVPDNAAWNSAYEKYKSYFEYGDSYAYQFDTEKGAFNYTGNQAYKPNVDSLQETRTKEAILGSIMFSATQIPSIDVTDSASVVNTMLTADSLRSTTFRYVYNSNPGGRNPYFGNAVPLRASNGYLFSVSDLNLDAAKTWQDEINLEGENLPQVYLSGGDASIINLDEYTRNDTISGIVHGDAYARYDRGNSRSSMYVEFPLNNVLSAKYDIYAVLLPSNINTNYSDTLQSGEVEDIVFNAAIYLDTDASSRPTMEAEDLRASQDSVTHVLLFKDFRFPKSYYNLEVASFPRLRLTLPRLTSGEVSRCEALNIDRIYLVPKGND